MPMLEIWVPEIVYLWREMLCCLKIIILSTQALACFGCVTWASPLTSLGLTFVLWKMVED